MRSLNLWLRTSKGPTKIEIADKEVVYDALKCRKNTAIQNRLDILMAPSPARKNSAGEIGKADEAEISDLRSGKRSTVTKIFPLKRGRNAFLWRTFEREKINFGLENGLKEERNHNENLGHKSDSLLAPKRSGHAWKMKKHEFNLRSSERENLALEHARKKGSHK